MTYAQQKRRNRKKKQPAKHVKHSINTAGGAFSRWAKPKRKWKTATNNDSFNPYENKPVTRNFSI